MFLAVMRNDNKEAFKIRMLQCLFNQFPHIL